MRKKCTVCKGKWGKRCGGLLYCNTPPLPACSPTHPPAQKVAVVKTTPSLEEIAEEDEEQVIGQLSAPKEKYNQDF